MDRMDTKATGAVLCPVVRFRTLSQFCLLGKKRYQSQSIAGNNGADDDNAMAVTIYMYWTSFNKSQSPNTTRGREEKPI